MSHLGHWLTALVDGELDGAERDHVLNHVAGCDPCRRDVTAMRALKRRLTALGETPRPAIDDGTAIEDRLLELARGGHPGGADAVLTSPHGRATPERTAHFPRADSRLIVQSWRLAAGSAGGALLAIGALAFMLGSSVPARPAPQVTPSVVSYLVQHAYDAGQAPAGSLPGSGLFGNLGQRSWPAGPALARPGRPATHLSGGQPGSAPAAGAAASTASPAASPAFPAVSPTSSPAAGQDVRAPRPAGLHSAGRYPR